MTTPIEVWYAIPSANPPRASACLRVWKERGYKTAVLLDPGAAAVPEADLTLRPGAYPGYFASVNLLAKAIGPRATIVVTGGDDMFPDMKLTAQEITAQFLEHFPDGFGVMQPIGDDLEGTDRICGSPWLGRGWIDRAYGGKGPFWPGYRAFYGDEELFLLTSMQELLWQRRDLTQRHEHWARHGAGAMLPYQRENQKLWDVDKALFRERYAAGWPGSDALEETA